MRKALHRATPSPAILISIAALAFAMAGAATALDGRNSVDKNDIQKNAVKSKQIKKAGVKAVDISPTVPIPKAYATVNSAGGVIEDGSSGIGDENVVAAGGVYGFRGLGFTPNGIIGQYLWPSEIATGNNAAGGPRSFIGDCPLLLDGPNQACMSTNTDDDAGPEAAAFFVIIF
jgi:hypothetical protein